MDSVLRRLGVLDSRISAARESLGGVLSCRERLCLLKNVPGLDWSMMRKLGSVNSGFCSSYRISGRETDFVAEPDLLPVDVADGLDGEAAGGGLPGPFSCF